MKTGHLFQSTGPANANLRFLNSLGIRGVQYVHCRGERKSQKACTKPRNFEEIRWKFGKVGVMKDLVGTGGNWTERTNIEGEFQNFWLMT